MAFTSVNDDMLSALVVHEQDPSVGYARRTIVVQSSDTVPVTMGTVVFRVKNVDTNEPYAPLTSNTALVATNEFAVVFGDKQGCKAAWIAGASDTAVNSVAFVRGDVILKDELILDATGFDRDSADHRKLKQLLENQGIVIEKTI